MAFFKCAQLTHSHPISCWTIGSNEPKKVEKFIGLRGSFDPENNELNGMRAKNTETLGANHLVFTVKIRLTRRLLGMPQYR